MNVTYQEILNQIFLKKNLKNHTDEKMAPINNMVTTSVELLQ